MTAQSIYNSISYISAASVLIPFVICLLNFRTLNTILRVLFLYILISIGVEVIGFLLSQNKIHNYLFQHLFTVIECTLIVCIYLFQFESKFHRRLIYTVLAGFLLLSLVLLFFKGGYNQGDNVISTFESCFIIALSSAYLVKTLNEISLSKSQDSYFSWLNAAFLLYFCTAFFLFLFDDFIETCEIRMAYYLYSLHLISNIAYNSILAIGVWKMKQT